MVDAGRRTRRVVGEVVRKDDGEVVFRYLTESNDFKLARDERDAWLNWPARISAQMAARLGVDPHTLHVALEAAVRDHLQELGELRPRVE